MKIKKPTGLAEFVRNSHVTNRVTFDDHVQFMEGSSVGRCVGLLKPWKCYLLWLIGCLPSLRGQFVNPTNRLLIRPEMFTFVNDGISNCII